MIAVSTEEEREGVIESLREASEWLDEDGWGLTASVYDGKVESMHRAARGRCWRPPLMGRGVTPSPACLRL